MASTTVYAGILGTKLVDVMAALLVERACVST